ncbi:hypothetical protein [Sphingomonas sp. MMS24-J13]|uniref:hypothetical protein n=1 Tax=Sphingomonas sp. MMS24-J13 TaxID=3238686 RepID=UPI00384EBA90
MAKHRIKTESQIGEEIRRRAQGAADAADQQVRIRTPSVTRIDEPTLYGSHWILETADGPGIAFVEKAAIQIAKIWDVVS